MPEGQPDASEEMDETATLRAMGNNALREGRHSEAVESYSSAIALSPRDHRLFSNRAAAYSKLDKVRHCVICEQALGGSPSVDCVNWAPTAVCTLGSLCERSTRRPSLTRRSASSSRLTSPRVTAVKRLRCTSRGSLLKPCTRVTPD